MFLVNCDSSEVHELHDLQHQDKKCRVGLTFLPKQTYCIVSASQTLADDRSCQRKKTHPQYSAAACREVTGSCLNAMQFAHGFLTVPLANWNTRIGLSRELAAIRFFMRRISSALDIPDVCMLVLGGLTGNSAATCAGQEKPPEATINGTRVSDVGALPPSPPLSQEPAVPPRSALRLYRPVRRFSTGFSAQPPIRTSRNMCERALTVYPCARWVWR